MSLLFKRLLCLTLLAGSMVAPSGSHAQTSDGYDLALIVEQTDLNTPLARPGFIVTYRITVMNQGSVPSGSYTVDEMIPPGMILVSATPAPDISPSSGDGGLVQWVVPTSNQLMPSARANFGVKLRIDDASLSPYRNVAEISADSGAEHGGDSDSDPADGSGQTDSYNDLDVSNDHDTGDEDDSDFEILALDGTYDLALVTTLHPSQAMWLTQNSIVSYLIKVKNQGTVASSNFTVVNTIPAGMTFVSAAGDNFSCRNNVPSTGRVTCHYIPPVTDALAPQSEAIVTLRLKAVDLTRSPFKSWAEITANSGYDIDSVPNSNGDAADAGAGSGNTGSDPTVDHNDINHGGTNGNRSIDEDDSDFAIIGAGQTRPITLQTFEAVDIDGSGMLRIDWSTSMEDANVGYHLYGRSDGGDWKRLLTTMIPAVAGASSGASYRRTIIDDEITELTITDIDLFGQEIPHGPFQIGQLYGTPANPIDESMPPVDHVDPVVVPEDIAKNKVYLDTDKVGIHRLTYEELRNAGHDFAGVPVSSLALTQLGRAIPARIEGKRSPEDPYAANLFGPGGFVEFVATELQSIYVDSNRYMLSVNSALSRTIPSDYESSLQGLALAGDYLQELRWNPDKAYSRSSPTQDPWYAMKVLAFGRKASKTISLTVPNQAYVKSRPGRIKVDLWTLSDDPNVNRDHSVVVRVNGTVVGRKVFEGIRSTTIDRPVPASVIKPGRNVIEIELPLNRGARLDQIYVDSIALSYPRRLDAVSGRAHIKDSRATAWQVKELRDPEVSVYRVRGAGVWRVPVRVISRGTRYWARFKGWVGRADWFIAGRRNMHKATIAPVPVSDDILQGSADYLVIAHPQFIRPELSRLTSQRAAEGLTTKIVSTEKIYAAFSSGMFDPIAIKRYIAAAKATMGTQYVLLVGGDSYDYKNHLGLRRPARGWIPSIYSETGQAIRHAPVDPMYGDTDDDGIPDIMLGRFPVQARSELIAMVDKTLNYPSSNHNGVALVASDKLDSATRTSFRNIGQRVSRSLAQAGWKRKMFSLQDLTRQQVRSRLIASINQGASMTSYIGHSDTRLWSFDGILTRTDVAGLQNHGNPTLVLQWGCWNTYYVEPRADAMAHEWLRQKNKGAVAVMGATTLTDAGTEEELAQELFVHIADGKTIGQAVSLAKLELAGRYSSQGVRDLLKAFVILGDPALVALD